MASGAESRPTTLPVALVRLSTPATSELVSLMSITSAQPSPTSVTRPSQRAALGEHGAPSTDAGLGAPVERDEALELRERGAR